MIGVLSSVPETLDGSPARVASLPWILVSDVITENHHIEGITARPVLDSNPRLLSWVAPRITGLVLPR